MIKKVHINMCPILDGYGVMTVFNSRTRPRVNRVYQLAGRFYPATDRAFPGTYGVRGKAGWVGMLRATRAVHNRAAGCFAVGGGIFENQL